MSGHKRTVRLAAATFTAPDGSIRVGTMGEDIEVHKDHIASFDVANGGHKPEPVISEPAVAVANEIEADTEEDKPRRPRRKS